MRGAHRAQFWQARSCRLVPVRDRVLLRWRRGAANAAGPPWLESGVMAWFTNRCVEHPSPSAPVAVSTVLLFVGRPVVGPWRGPRSRFTAWWLGRSSPTGALTAWGGGGTGVAAGVAMRPPLPIFPSILPGGLNSTEQTSLNRFYHRCCLDERHRHHHHQRRPASLWPLDVSVDILDRDDGTLGPDEPAAVALGRRPQPNVNSQISLHAWRVQLQLFGGQVLTRRETWSP